MEPVELASKRQRVVPPTESRSERANATKTNNQLDGVESFEENTSQENEDSSEESSEEECNITIPPCTNEGDRIQFGLRTFPALQENLLGVEAFRNCVRDNKVFERLKKLSEQLAAYSMDEKHDSKNKRSLKECVNKPSTKLLVQDILDHTLGYTFFVRKSDQPQNLLEEVALEIFDFHLERNKRQTTQQVDPTISGAEFWAGCCEDLKRDNVGMHFDKDYNLEEASGGRINFCPLLGTITYLTSVGAATIVVGERDKFVKVRAEESTTTKAVQHVAVSYPEANKHITFDGRMLHLASEKLQIPCRNEKKEKRIVFLVNVWVNGFPTDMSRLVVNETASGDVDFVEQPLAEPLDVDDRICRRVEGTAARKFTPDDKSNGLVAHIEITNPELFESIVIGDAMEHMVSDMVVNQKVGELELIKFDEKRTFAGKFARFDTILDVAHKRQARLLKQWLHRDRKQHKVWRRRHRQRILLKRHRQRKLWLEKRRELTTFLFSDKTIASLFQVTTSVTRHNTQGEKALDETLSAFPSSSDILTMQANANEDGWLVL